MSQPDYVTAAAALFNAFIFQQLIPLLVLTALGYGFSRVLIAAQGRPDFDAAEFFRDDTGKLSFVRMGTAVCLVLHSWAYVTRTHANTITFNETLLYVGVWSGSSVILLVVEAWKGVRIQQIEKGGGS